MKFKLLGKKRGWFGTTILLLEALERGQIERTRLSRANNSLRATSLMDTISFHAGIDIEVATLFAGQQIEWRMKKWPSWNIGETIDSEALPQKPGPTDLNWESFPVI